MSSRLFSDGLLRLAALTGASDAELLGRYVRDRDEAAFEMLLRRHGPMVLGVCRRTLGDGPDADDAFQATFLVLIRKAGSVSPQSMVGNFLYGVAVRTAAHARAARRKTRHRELPDVPDPRTREPGVAELTVILDSELSRLPEPYRAAVVLCELEGRPLAEVARLLGWPVGTVASRLARGRKRLADRLTRRGVAIPAAGLTLVAGAVAQVPNRLTPVPALAAGAARGGSQLANEVLKAMFVHKLRVLGVLVAAVGSAMFGVAALTGSVATSAPPRERRATRPVVALVRPDPATPKQMEAWWADLAGDGVKATQAVFALYTRPKESVAFLKDKLQPLKVDKEQVRKWLAALGSDKADVWKPAFEKLRYFDPRLAIDLREIPDELTTPAARQRLGAIMADEPAESLIDLNVKTQVLGFQQDGKPIANWGLYFYCYRAKPQNQKPGPPIRVISCASNITTVGDARHSPRPTWTRAARAAVLLEHIGSPEAVAILKEMATGHPDALPTRTAKEALARLADRD